MEYALQRRFLRTPPTHHSAILESNTTLPNRFKDQRLSFSKVPKVPKKSRKNQPALAPTSEVITLPYVSLNEYRGLKDTNSTRTNRNDYPNAIMKSLPYMTQTRSEYFLDFEDQQRWKAGQVIEKAMVVKLKESVKYGEAKKDLERKVAGGGKEAEQQKDDGTSESTGTKQRAWQKGGDKKFRQQVREKKCQQDAEEMGRLKKKADDEWKSLNRSLQMHNHRNSIVGEAPFNALKKDPNHETLEKALPVGKLRDLRMGYFELWAVMGELHMRRIEGVKQLVETHRDAWMKKFVGGLYDSVKRMVLKEGLWIMQSGDEEVWGKEGVEGGKGAYRVGFSKELTRILKMMRDAYETEEWNQVLRARMEEKRKEQEERSTQMDQEKMAQQEKDFAKMAVDAANACLASLDLPSNAEDSTSSPSSISQSTQSTAASQMKKRPAEEEEEQETPLSPPTTPKKRKSSSMRHVNVSPSSSQSSPSRSSQTPNQQTEEMPPPPPPPSPVSSPVSSLPISPPPTPNKKKRKASASSEDLASFRSNFQLYSQQMQALGQEQQEEQQGAAGPLSPPTTPKKRKVVRFQDEMRQSVTPSGPSGILRRERPTMPKKKKVVRFTDDILVVRFSASQSASQSRTPSEGSRTLESQGQGGELYLSPPSIPRKRRGAFVEVDVIMDEVDRDEVMGDGGDGDAMVDFGDGGDDDAMQVVDGDAMVEVDGGF